MPKKNSLLDGTCTSPQWRKARPKLCVLPVGAFEQHSSHLPLATDDIQVEYFAQFIARELGAALLPTLPYGTSLEHSGFAGTMTLRPETLMQIVRDIADAAERQGFTTMILLNGHGGNFALVPVVRDINRLDRKLKILLVTWYDSQDETLLESKAQGKPVIHAEESETSVMLALRPDLVRPGRPAWKPSVKGFLQPDLATFGIGFIAPNGAYGDASLASREKGEKLILSIKRNMVKHIRQRLQWLQKTRVYSGKGRTQG
jgi:creatinine amidohydrolase